MQLHLCRKDDIFRQRRLNDSEVEGEIAFRRVYPARAYSTVVVLVSIICMVLLKSTTTFCTGSVISNWDPGYQAPIIKDKYFVAFNHYRKWIY